MKKTSKAGKRKKSRIEHLLETQRYDIGDEAGATHLFLHPLRRGEFLYLLSNPCCTLKDLATHFKKSINTVKWHVRTLRKADIVGVYEAHKRSRHCVKGYLDDIDITIMCTLAPPSHLKFYRYLLENPGTTLTQCAEYLGSTPPRAHQIKTALAEVGLVKQIHAGRVVHLYPTDLLKRRIDYHLQHPEHLEGALLTILKKDGAMPEVVSRDGDSIKMSILDARAGKRYVFTIPKNPFTSLLERMENIR